MKKLLTAVITAVLLATGVAPAWAETDPFPGVAHMAEIPGTRVSSDPGQRESDWYQTDAYLSFSCPAGAGSAIEVNVGNGVRSVYCVKTWRPQSVIDAWQKYYEDQRAANDAAYQKSLAWNTANPGKQKCFSWGPLISPDGGESSGGVCANPVYSSSSDSETVTREPEADFETTETNNRVSAFMSSLAQVTTSTSKTSFSLPKFKKAKKLGLTVAYRSERPKVCQIQDDRVSFRSSGTCVVRIRISDPSGNSTQSKLRISRS